MFKLIDYFVASFVKGITRRKKHALLVVVRGPFLNFFLGRRNFNPSGKQELGSRFLLSATRYKSQQA
jgi:hypothetical protein